MKGGREYMNLGRDDLLKKNKHGNSHKKSGSRRDGGGGGIR
jgi:hypothetical protein